MVSLAKRILWKKLYTDEFSFFLKQLIAQGTEKLASVPSGGAGAAAAPAAGGAGEAAPAEKKEEEPAEESDDDMGLGLFD